MKKLLILTILFVATPGFADDTDTGAPAEEEPVEVDEERLDQIYNRCRQHLSLGLKTEYLEMASIYKKEWLSKYCGLYEQPLPPDRSEVRARTLAALAKEKAAADHTEYSAINENEWPGERIVAHVLFWPGLVSLTTSISYLAVSAKAGVAGDTAGGWAPNLILGSALVIGAIVASSKYSVKKRSLGLAFEPSIGNLTVKW